MSGDYLTDTDIAREYLARGGYGSVGHLVKWMNQRGIGHRNAASIAGAVNDLQADFRANVEGGTTADDQQMENMR